MNKAERTVYVTGIPQDCTYHDVRGLFKDFGEVEYAFVSTNHGLKHAFIRYKLLSPARKVVKVKTVTIKGTVVKVRARHFRGKNAPQNSAPTSSQNSACPRVSRLRQATAVIPESAANSEMPLEIKPKVTDQPSSEAADGPSLDTAEAASKLNPPTFIEAVSVERYTGFAVDASAEVGTAVKVDPGETLVMPPSYTSHVKDSLAHRFETTPLTMGYGTNGELMFGCDAGFGYPPTYSAGPNELDRRVVRVSGIPLDWDASGLYKHLKNAGIAVTAVLVYADYNERSQRDGLIQLATGHQAMRITQQPVLKTPLLTLGVVPSAVASIGPVRRTYFGQFSAYSKDDEGLSNGERRTAYGYSVAEPFEPGQTPPGAVPGNSQRAKQAAPQTLAEPLVPQETPEVAQEQAVRAFRSSSDPEARLDCGSECSSGCVSECGPGCISQCRPSCGVRLDDECRSPFVRSGQFAYRGPYGQFGQLVLSSYTPSSCCDPTSPGNIVETPPSAVSDAANELKPCQNSKNPSTPFFTAEAHPVQSPLPAAPNFGPLMLPHKPSQTVVVDNFNPAELRDPRALAMSMAQFGQVHEIDIVCLGVLRARAYITFANPVVAEVALSRLRLCSSSTGERLLVRLA